MPKLKSKDYEKLMQLLINKIRADKALEDEVMQYLANNENVGI